MVLNHLGPAILFVVQACRLLASDADETPAIHISLARSGIVARRSERFNTSTRCVVFSAGEIGLRS